MRYPEIIVEVAHPFRPVVAHLRTENTGGMQSIATLRQQVRALVARLCGKVFRNIETGHEIIV
jgi:hypothetical protein